MKTCLLLSVFCCCLASLAAQDTSGQWTWMAGDNHLPQRPVYRTKGVADPSSHPGLRNNASSWTDASGNLWLFGGGTYANGDGLYTNDLWKYDTTTSLWTWMSGDNRPSQRGNYGTKGLSAPTNKPGARMHAIEWTDASGNLWLFGGYGYAASLVGQLNDLWKYVPSTGEWTWVRGDSTENAKGHYGNKGEGSDSTYPPARWGAVGWSDSKGNQWLFGGYTNGSFVYSLNDLWKYTATTSQWTWVSGDSIPNQKGLYGLSGVPGVNNMPGSRTLSVAWTDKSDDLWLYGGRDFYFNGHFYLNDLWRYSTVSGEWTWMNGDSTAKNQMPQYGARGVATPTSNPGARGVAISGLDAEGNLLLFGGAGFINTIGGAFNDVWKYIPLTRQWTWIGGDSALNESAIFTVKGETSSNAAPGARYSSASWSFASGDLWVMGGFGNVPGNSGGENAKSLNDLWRYTPSTNQWTWKSGDNQYALLGVYGIKGIASSTNKPGQRENALTWTDSAGNLWLFGGFGFDTDKEGYLNDLWKYVPSSGLWTWISGDSINGQAGTYGTRGTASAGNKPGARYGAIGWTDATGNLWLFGGNGHISVSPGTLNDLWKYNPATNEWTWISGDNTLTGRSGSYGKRAVAAPSNLPAGRYGAVSWKDSSGDLWLFGGHNIVFVPPRFVSSHTLNDLWKYSPYLGQWTWMSGDSSANAPGIFGTKGISAPSNKPSSRDFAAGWSDRLGNLWLFGGGNLLNDLWRYAPSSGEWTWMGGDNSTQQPGIYGTRGVSAAFNKPGGRYGAVSWTDGAGKFWLFGGAAAISSFDFQGLNDLWSYDPATGQWAWMKGDSTINPPAVYGVKGLANMVIKPSGRRYASGWTDNAANLWLFGGHSFENDFDSDLNDLFKYSISSVTLPVRLTHFSAQKQQRSVRLDWTTAGEQNSHYFTVERSSSGRNYDSLGRIAASGIVSTAKNYSFLDVDPFPGMNYYRLKQADFDGRFEYSKTLTVEFDKNRSRLAIIQNPVHNLLQLQVQLVTDEDFVLQIRNASGILLVEKKVAGRMGNSRHLVPVNHLSGGTYFLTLKSPHLNVSKKFLKQ